VELPVTAPAPFPWRTAAIAAAAVAAVELVVLLLVAATSIVATADTAEPSTRAQQRKAAASAATVAKPMPATASTAQRPSEAAGLPRRKVTVVVLNGNGRTGAAAAAATRVQQRGYRVGVVGNAPSHDYPQSLVMYRPGFAAEGKRLARDLGIRLVTPLDGMRPSQLHGAHTVVILGS
jgi:hypothetical protein